MINLILFILETIRLQTSDFDIFLRNLGFRAPPPSPTLQPVDDSASFEIAFWITFIIFMGIFLFFFRKIWNAKKAYAGEGDQLGKFEIIIQAGDHLVGNLSRYEMPFLPQTTEYIEQIPYMKKVSKHLEDLVLDGSLFAYEMRVTNDTIADLKGKSRDILIISSDDLESARCSYRKKEYSRFTGEATKIVLSYVTSRKHDAISPDNVVTDVYIISPIPMYSKETKKPFGFMEKAFLEQQHVIIIKKLAQTKDLAKAVMMMEEVTIAEQKLDLKDERIEDLKDMADGWQEDLMTHRRREDVGQGRLNEQPLMGTTQRVSIPERGDPWGWFILFAVAPIASFLIIPEFNQSIPGWLGSIFGLGFMIGFRYMFARRQRNEELREQAGATIL